MELIRDVSNFEIKYIEKGEIISYGDGPKREFLETAVMEFFETCLIQNNVCTYFNMDMITSFTSDELYCIGLMLHTIICHSKNHLPFRLPILLLKAVKGRKLKKIELEYFAQNEDPEIFNNARQFSDDPDGFKSLDSDFATYEDLLYDICGCKNMKKSSEINSDIAKGIIAYSEIKNLDIMNYPTLDYYFSGNYTINRLTLLKNLKIMRTYKETITHIIKTLPEKKLYVLLRNWSGTSVVKKSFVYEIVVEKKSDLYFATCSITIHIPKELLINPIMQPHLVDMLCTPITTMIDD